MAWVAPSRGPHQLVDVLEDRDHHLPVDTAAAPPTTPSKSPSLSLLPQVDVLSEIPSNAATTSGSPHHRPPSRWRTRPDSHPEPREAGGCGHRVRRRRESWIKTYRRQPGRESASCRHYISVSLSARIPPGSRSPVHSIKRDCPFPRAGAGRRRSSLRRFFGQLASR